MKTLSFLMKYSRSIVLLAAVAGIVSGASNTGLLAVINSVLSSDGSPGKRLLWGFVALCIVVPVTRITSELMLTHLGQGTIYDLRMRISRRILSVPLRHLEELGAPKLMATLTDDIPAITQVVTLLPVLSINLAILIGCLVYLGMLSWQILLAVVGFIVVGIVSYQLPVARAMKYFRRSWDERDRLFKHFRALTEGSKELKLHHGRREVFLSRVLHDTATAFRRMNIRAQTIYTIASSWGQLLVFVVIGVVLFALPSLPLGEMDRKVMTGFTLVLLYLMTPLQVLMNSLPGLSRAEIALGRVEKMGVDLAEHASDAERDLVPLDEGWTTVRLSGVTHTYHREGEERDFLLGPIDLELTRGELVFVAGGNGSGKTTLAKILVGLYLPEEGTITLDGEVIDDERRESYRQLFTAVFSDFFLFDQFLGLESADLDERARGYLEGLQLAHKVEVDGGTLSTTELSQGQRKRLALLTAFLEDRPIYVFDEWAADQDPYFRDVFYLEILQELKRRGKTVIVISHDDRYYNAGDRLVKLEYGKIVKEEPIESDTVVPAAATGAHS